MKTNPRLIDRYISGQILLGFAIVLTILMGIAWFSQIIRLLSFIVSKNASFLSFLKMTSFLLPDLFLVVAPVAIFISVLFVYNKLIADKELVIMLGSGMPPRRLALPAIKIAGALTTFCLLLTIWLNPEFSKKYRDVALDLSNDISSLLVREGEFTQLTQGVTIFVKSSKGNVMTDIFIDDRRAPGTERTILAEKGEIETSKDSIVIMLENGSLGEVNGGRYSFGRFQSYVADLNITGSSASRNPKIYEYPTFDLLRARELGLVSDKMPWSKFVGEFHRRITDPLYIMVFVLVALAAQLNSRLNRRGGSRAAIYAVGMVLAIRMSQIWLGGVMSEREYGWILSYVFLLPIAFLCLHRIARGRRT